MQETLRSTTQDRPTIIGTTRCAAVEIPHDKHGSVICDKHGSMTKRSEDARSCQTLNRAIQDTIQFQKGSLGKRYANEIDEKIGSRVPVPKNMMTPIS